MSESAQNNQKKSKGIFSSLIEKIDSKLKEKANQGSCCAPKAKDNHKPEKSSCCG